MKRLMLVGMAVLCLAPRVSVAAPAAAVVVMDFPPDDGITEKLLKKLDRALQSSVQEQGYSIYTGAETRAALGTDIGNQRRDHLMACTDAVCAVELCGAIGANFIVRGRVVPLYEDTAISLTLVDGRGKVINELQQQLKGKDADTLTAGLAQMVSDLVAPLKTAPSAPIADAPSRLAPAEGSAAPAAATSAGSSAAGSSSNQSAPTVQQDRPDSPGASSTTNIVSWVLIIGGGAAIAGGGVLAGVAAGQVSGLQTQYNTAYSQDDTARETTLRNQANNNVILPAVVGGVGVAALAVGIVLRVTGSGPAQVSMSPGGGPAFALSF